EDVTPAMGTGASQGEPVAVLLSSGDRGGDGFEVSLRPPIRNELHLFLRDDTTRLHAGWVDGGFGGGDEHFCGEDGLGNDEKIRDDGLSRPDREEAVSGERLVSFALHDDAVSSPGEKRDCEVAGAVAESRLFDLQ